MKDNLFCFLFLILVNLFCYAPNTTASPIINGVPDDRHLFKFHVSIHEKGGPQNAYKYSCGGSIISEKYILTAAHCFMDVTMDTRVIQKMSYPCGRTKIIAGTNHRNGPGIERDIVRVFIPAGHDRRLFSLDLAVAELNENLGVHQHPDKLAIVPLGELDPHSYAGVKQEARFCGFGYDILVRTHDGRAAPSRSSNTINRVMTVRILGRNECSTLAEHAFCARNADTRVLRTAWIGDSGSGLIYENKLIGVLSHGPNNLDPSNQIVFTKLHGNMRFIIAAQNPHGDHRSMHVLHENPGNHPRCTIL